MNIVRTPLALAISSLSALALSAVFATDAAAQKRPSGVDTSRVQETKRVVRRTPGKPPTRTQAQESLMRIAPALDGASILIDAKPAKITVNKQENQLLIDGIKPGKHTFTYDHPDYVILNKDLVVKPATEILWTPSMKLATVELNVKSEPGTKVYVDDVQRGETLPNGTLRLDDIRIGTHQIKLVKDTYEEHRASVEFEYGKPVTHAVKLVPLPSSAEFSEFFDVDPRIQKWTKPASGWSVKDGRLWLANSPEILHPTNINYRDFVMAFHLRLKNAGGAAWIVRAKDPRNYYLFYLSGPQGQFPGYFNTYVVRDGKFDPTNPIQSVPVIANLKAGAQLQIEITAKGNVIEHTVTAADTGKSEPLDAFKDKDSTFSFGSVGFRTVGTEQFSIDEMFVQPK
jgi:hypothetical protein